MLVGMLTEHIPAFYLYSDVVINRNHSYRQAYFWLDPKTPESMCARPDINRNQHTTTHVIAPLPLRQFATAPHDDAEQVALAVEQGTFFFVLFRFFLWSIAFGNPVINTFQESVQKTRKAGGSQLHKIRRFGNWQSHEIAWNWWSFTDCIRFILQHSVSLSVVWLYKTGWTTKIVVELTQKWILL